MLAEHDGGVLDEDRIGVVRELLKPNDLEAGVGQRALIRRMLFDRFACIDRTLYVGLSTRTDSAGIEALREIAAPLGYKVVQAELRGCLHLKTGATFAGPDAARRPVLLYSPELVDAAQFEGVEALAVEERRGANCVRAGDRLILAAGNPRTAALLRERGFQVTEVDVSELQKAESAVTCMSLIDDRP